jgi:hypothetical protein
LTKSERKAIASRLREILSESAEARKNASKPDYWATWELGALQSLIEELAIKVEVGTFPEEEVKDKWHQTK